MNNKSLRRVLAVVASTGLALAGFSAVATPAQAADRVTTKFKIHLNVPSSVASTWNIWSWGDCAGGNDNQLGASDRNIGTTLAPDVVNMDWTPNFTNDDAYGSYAEFTMPCAMTALNNVLRTTESWDGQEAADATPEIPEVPEVPEVPAVPAVEDDPATPDVDETAAAIPAIPAVPAVPAVPAQPAKVAIPASDKPLGGDNIFPAGESWWNVGTGQREYPLQDVVDYKIHVNMPLAAAQANGWSLWTWGDYNVQAENNAPLLEAFKVVTPVTKTVIKTVYKVVKGKKVATKVPTKVTTNVTTYPYKGKVPSDLRGTPFSGSDSYGAFAVVKMPRIYVAKLGFLLRRSSPTTGWENRVKSGDFKSELNNGVAAGSTESFIQMGASYLTSTRPTFTGRLTGSATLNNGVITVTPVFPSAPSLRGARPDSIVVSAKKGGTTKTCTIASTYNAAFDTAQLNLAASCQITDIPTPAFADGDATWEITIQGTSSGTGKAALGPTPAAKIVVAKGPKP